MRGPRGCDVARKATWQRHADPAQRLRGAIYTYIFIYLLSINKFFVLPYMGRVISLETVGSYKPDGFQNVFRVGLSSTYAFDAGDVALDRAEQMISRVDRVDQRTMINHINTCYLKGVITAKSNATWLTEERRSCGAWTTRSDQEHVRKSRRYNDQD